MTTRDGHLVVYLDERQTFCETLHKQIISHGRWGLARAVHAREGVCTCSEICKKNHDFLRHRAAKPKKLELVGATKVSAPCSIATLDSDQSLHSRAYGPSGRTNKPSVEELCIEKRLRCILHEGLLFIEKSE